MPAVVDIQNSSWLTLLACSLSAPEVDQLNLFFKFFHSSQKDSASEHAS